MQLTVAMAPVPGIARAPPTGHKALQMPTSPSEKVQHVSTQPELPVRCGATQAHRQDRKRRGNGHPRLKICFKI